MHTRLVFHQLSCPVTSCTTTLANRQAKMPVRSNIEARKSATATTTATAVTTTTTMTTHTSMSLLRPRKRSQGSCLGTANHIRPMPIPRCARRQPRAARPALTTRTHRSARTDTGLSAISITSISAANHNTNRVKGPTIAPPALALAGLVLLLPVSDRAQTIARHRRAPKACIGPANTVLAAEILE